MSDDQPPALSPAMQITIADDGATLDTAQVTVTAHQGDLHLAHPWQPRWAPSAAEAQVLLDAMPTDRVPEISALPSSSRMPVASNPHVVGRDAVLQSLATALHGGERVAIGPKAAATGLGGIGKTSVAAECVHRYGPTLPVGWVAR